MDHSYGHEHQLDHSYGHEHQNSEFFWRIKHVYDWVQLKCIYICILDVDTTWPIIYDPGVQEKCQSILNIVVITVKGKVQGPI